MGAKRGADVRFFTILTCFFAAAICTIQEVSDGLRLVNRGGQRDEYLGGSID